MTCVDVQGFGSAEVEVSTKKDKKTKGQRDGHLRICQLQLYECLLAR